MSFKTRMEDPVRHANRRFRSRVVIIWMESMLPTRTFDFVTSTKFVNAYCNRSRSLVNLTSTSNAGVVKIDDVTNNGINQIFVGSYASYYIYAVTTGGNSLHAVHGRWSDVWTTAQRQPAALSAAGCHCS